MQVTVVFLVDADKVLPSKQQWPQVWEKQQAWLHAKKAHEDEQVSICWMLHTHEYILVLPYGKGADYKEFKQECLSAPMPHAAAMLLFVFYLHHVLCASTTHASTHIH